jgi:hypothetical protein
MAASPRFSVLLFAKRLRWSARQLATKTGQVPCAVGCLLFASDLAALLQCCSCGGL